MKPAEDEARDHCRIAACTCGASGSSTDAHEENCGERSPGEFANTAALIRRSREEGALAMREAAAKIASFSCRIHGDTVTLTAEAIRAIDPAGAAGQGGTNAD